MIINKTNEAKFKYFKRLLSSINNSIVKQSKNEILKDILHLIKNSNNEMELYKNLLINLNGKHTMSVDKIQNIIDDINRLINDVNEILKDDYIGELLQILTKYNINIYLNTHHIVDNYAIFKKYVKSTCKNNNKLKIEISQNSTYIDIYAAIINNDTLKKCKNSILINIESINDYKLEYILNIITGYVNNIDQIKFINFRNEFQDLVLGKIGYNILFN